MKSHLLVLIFSLSTLYLVANNYDQTSIYQMTEQGYLCAPQQSAYGIIATNNRSSEIYLIQNEHIRTLVSSPGCGRYTILNADGTLLGFKSINSSGEQAPAILDIATGEVKLLDEYTHQCGQISFAVDGTISYTYNHDLVVHHQNEIQRIDLGFYTNITRMTPDANLILTSDENGSPMQIDLTNGDVHTNNSIQDAYVMTPSPDGTRVVWEQANMGMYVWDQTSAQLFAIGQGFSPIWDGNERLYFSRSEYEGNDVFRFKGISVRSIQFDGTNEQIILPCSMDCPEDLGLLADGRLAICYAANDRRLAAIDPLNPQSEEVLYRIPQSDRFGRIFCMDELYTNNTPRQKPQRSQGNDLPIDAIPYINQVYDVPTSYAGCYGYGPVACAPSTSCMLLGYLRFVQPHPVTSRRSNCEWGKTNNYSWYVGQEYQSLTGYTFNLIANGQGCNAKGAYGFMWTGNNSPYTRMVGFYKNNGIKDATQDYSGLSKIRTECNNNYPYSWCITSSKSSGHLILPFRADTKCVKSNGTWTMVACTGSVVVQDPYGNANNSPWVGDGRHATYDYAGYNNGYLTMNNAWGVSVHQYPQADEQAPKIISVITDKLNSRGYTITCTVEDNIAVTEVQFATWLPDHSSVPTIVDQITGNKTSYSSRIASADHQNLYGKYATKITAKDGSGNTSDTTIYVIVPEPTEDECNENGWKTKGDMLLTLQAQYNEAYSKKLAWAKKEGDTIYYHLNDKWLPEDQVDGTEPDAAYFIETTTSNRTGNMYKLISSADWSWLMKYICSVRENAGMESGTGICNAAHETLWRKEVSAFFLCSPGNSTYPSYTTAGKYEQFQPAWGDVFCKHPATDINNLSAPTFGHNTQGQILIQNGHLLIVREGHIYTILGSKLE